MTPRLAAPARAGPVPAALAALAAAHQVETAFTDAEDTRRQASPEALTAALAALGAPIGHPDDAPDALREAGVASARRRVEPVLVAWEGHLPPVSLRLPSGSGAVRCHLVPEEGAPVVRHAEEDGSVEMEGERFEAASVSFPETLPRGIHTFVAEARGWEARSTVVSAPERAYVGDDARHRGVFVPLHALHSRLSWGAGSLGDLAELAAWLGGLGGDVVATLPLLAAFLRDPCEPSPYAPVSRRFWNELYVDVEAVPEVEASGEVRRTLDAARDEVADLRSGTLVAHERQAALQRQVLEQACDHLYASAGPRLDDHGRFLAGDPAVVDYARFRAVGEERGADWRHWPGALRSGAASERDADERATRYHGYVQWLFTEQLARLRHSLARSGVELHLDLPLGAHPWGYDVWRHRHAFVEGVSAGAPPDAFFPGGQDWGFPPLHPAGSREDGHSYLRACLHHHMAAADSLRIDHVMGLNRLYLVPEGFDATEGVYARYPAEELYALLSVASHRHGCRLVGEDLGTVPAVVRERMARHGVARTYVVPFEALPGTNPVLPEPPEESVALLNTHDLPAFRAFWTGSDVDERVELDQLDAGEASSEREERDRLRRALTRFLAERGLLDGDAGHDAGMQAVDSEHALVGLLAFVGASPARTALATLEDLWLEERAQNVPGTTDERPNWRRRAALDLEELSARRDVTNRLRALLEGRPPTQEREA